jgi:hypothetical protein
MPNEFIKEAPNALERLMSKLHKHHPKTAAYDLLAFTNLVIHYELNPNALTRIARDLLIAAIGQDKPSTVLLNRSLQFLLNGMGESDVTITGFEIEIKYECKYFGPIHSIFNIERTDQPDPNDRPYPNDQPDLNDLEIRNLQSKISLLNREVDIYKDKSLVSEVRDSIRKGLSVPPTNATSEIFVEDFMSADHMDIELINTLLDEHVEIREPKYIIVSESVGEIFASGSKKFLKECGAEKYGVNMVSDDSNQLVIDANNKHIYFVTGNGSVTIHGNNNTRIYVVGGKEVIIRS